jgi:hypothetical protein
MAPLPNPHTQKLRSSEDTFPVLQEVQLLSEAAPIVELIFPSSQDKQEDAVELELYFPTSQSWQGLIPLSSLNFPAGQTSHSSA